MALQIFTTDLYYRSLQDTCTRALTFKNFCPGKLSRCLSSQRSGSHCPGMPCVCERERERKRERERERAPRPCPDFIENTFMENNFCVWRCKPSSVLEICNPGLTGLLTLNRFLVHDNQHQHHHILCLSSSPSFPSSPVFLPSLSPSLPPSLVQAQFVWEEVSR